jgi:hypothetical protein
MQTFLPYESFSKSAASLDYRRLGKQRVEAMQIINVLLDIQQAKGWRNHPAVRMWAGYEDALKIYHDVIIKEWLSRGYRNSMKLMFEFPHAFAPDIENAIQHVNKPWWLGNEEMHRSHRSRLIEKLPEHYLSQWPNDKGYNDSKYWWPDNDTRTYKII